MKKLASAILICVLGCFANAALAFELTAEVNALAVVDKADTATPILTIANTADEALNAFTLSRVSEHMQSQVEHTESHRTTAMSKVNLVVDNVALPEKVGWRSSKTYKF